jgi:hypothetical protein
MKEDLALQQQMLVNSLLHQVNLNFLGLHVALHAIPSCTYLGFFFPISSLSFVLAFFCSHGRWVMGANPQASVCWFFSSHFSQLL